jgi:hypothetical protein
MSELNLDKLRRLSKKCSDNKKTQEYVHKVCLKIRKLLINYAKDTRQKEYNVLKKYLGHDASPKNFSSGQINTKYINHAIDNGNIRERMTIITNFCMSGCSVILWAVEKKVHLTQKGINILRKRLYNLTGVSSVKKFNKYIRNCENNGFVLPCKFVSITSDSSVSASRMLAIPLREARVKYINEYFVNIKDVYPKLSNRELEYIKDNNYKITNNKLQWITGLQYWKVNDKNFYIELMRHHKQMIVCGPSGNTDLNMSILRLFDNFDINLAIFACISHMCNQPHHSPCEILLASIPYGLNDWTISEDSFKYVNNKLKKYQ